MKQEVQKALRNLLSVKSIVTLVLTAVFSFLSLKGCIDGGQFLNIFSIVIAFYFGTQHQKETIRSSEKEER